MNNENLLARFPEILERDLDGAFIAVIKPDMTKDSMPQFYIGQVLQKPDKKCPPKLEIVGEVTLEQAQNAIDHPRYLRALFLENLAKKNIQKSENELSAPLLRV